MALKQQNTWSLPSEMQKQRDHETVRNFLVGTESPKKRSVEKPGKQAAPGAAILVDLPRAGEPAPSDASGGGLDHLAINKARLMFDPPEELRDLSGGPTSDGSDSAATASTHRTAKLQRAEHLTALAVHNISIREATSLEQRRAKEEATYAAFDDLYAQHDEIFQLKQQMELEKHDSNYSKIHTLLFGPRPDDCGPLGDVDVYHKVQELVRRFAYRRFGLPEGGGDPTVAGLQEKLIAARDMLEAQRVKIAALTSTLTTSVTEIAGLRALLAEKNDELVQSKQKVSFLQAQVKHMKESRDPAARGGSVRSGSVAAKEREARELSGSGTSLSSPGLPSGGNGQMSAPVRSGSHHQELLSDFQHLLKANMMLEQESIALRARLTQRGDNLSDIKALLAANSHVEQDEKPMDREKLRAMLRAMPTSSAVITLKKTRANWLRREERMACDALEAYDRDTNVELIVKPTFDLRTRRTSAVIPTISEIAAKAAKAGASGSRHGTASIVAVSRTNASATTTNASAAGAARGSTKVESGSKPPAVEPTSNKAPSDPNARTRSKSAPTIAPEDAKAKDGPATKATTGAGNSERRGSDFTYQGVATVHSDEELEDDDNSAGERGDPNSNPTTQHLWHTLRIRMLASVAISRADCLRRETFHITKLRHRVAKLEEELGRTVSERAVVAERCEKAEQELHESKTTVAELVVRCEKLGKALEETELARQKVALEAQLASGDMVRSSRAKAMANRAQARRHGNLGIDATTVNPSMNRAALAAPPPALGAAASSSTAASVPNFSLSAAADGSSTTTSAAVAELQNQLSLLNEVMSNKIYDLETELANTREELHHAQARLIRDGMFYGTTSPQLVGQMQQPASATNDELIDVPQHPCTSSPTTATAHRSQRGGPAGNSARFLALRDAERESAAKQALSAGGAALDDVVDELPGSDDAQAQGPLRIRTSPREKSRTTSPAVSTSISGGGERRFPNSVSAVASVFDDRSVPPSTVLRVHTLEKQLSQCTQELTQLRWETEQLRCKLQVSEEQRLAKKSEGAFSFSENVAQRIVPRLRRWLERARTRMLDVTPSAGGDDGRDLLGTAVDGGEPPSHRAILASDAATGGGDAGAVAGEPTFAVLVQRMRSLVKPNSVTDHVIRRQLELRQHLQHLMDNRQWDASSAGGGGSDATAVNSPTASGNSAAVGELRVLWLELLHDTEARLAEAKQLVQRKALKKLVTDTIEGMLECETTFALRQDDALYRLAALRFAEHDERHRITAEELVDVRSAEQLQREHLAQSELKRSLLDLVRDIEVKRAEFLAADTVDTVPVASAAAVGGTPAVTAALRVQITVPQAVPVAARIGLSGVDAPTTAGGSAAVPWTMATICATAGFATYTPEVIVGWNRARRGAADLFPDGVDELLIPIFSATAARVVEATFGAAVEFFVRYAVQRCDSLSSIGARFGAGLSSIRLPHTRRGAGSLAPETLVVDVYLSGDAAIACLSHDPAQTLVLARIVTRVPSVHAACRALNIDAEHIQFFNQALSPGSAWQVAVDITPPNASAAALWLERGQLSVPHVVRRHETLDSVARDYDVPPTNIRGTVRELATVDIVLSHPSHVDKLCAEAAGILLSWSGESNKRRRLDVVFSSADERRRNSGNHGGGNSATTTTLAAWTGRNRVSRLNLEFPNVDRPSAFIGTIDYAVKLRTVEQLRFALESEHCEVIALGADTERTDYRVLSSVSDAVQLLRQQCRTVCAIVTLPSHDLDAVVRRFSCQRSDIFVWNVDLDADHNGGHIDVVSRDEFDSARVCFSIAHAYFRRLVVHNDNDTAAVQRILQALAHDVLEIVAFPCTPAMLRHCEVPYLDPQTGIVHIQVLTRDVASARRVVEFLEREGSVSKLSHLHTAMLDNLPGRQPASSSAEDLEVLALQVAPGTGVVVCDDSSTGFYHSVSAKDTMFSVALRYDVTVEALVQANAVLWYKAVAQGAKRRQRKRVLIASDTDAKGEADLASDDPVLLPLLKQAIHKVYVPIGLKLRGQLDTGGGGARVTLAKQTMSFLHAANSIGQRCDALFVDASVVALNVGTVLRVPPAPTRRSLATRRQQLSGLRGMVHYAVEGKGDTLESVCERFGVSAREMLLENPAAMQLREGAVISYLPIPHDAPRYVVEHPVTATDTAGSVCALYNIAPQDLLAENRTLLALEGADSVLAPVDADDVDDLLDTRFVNVYTLVANISDASIAKTFGCSEAAVARINSMVSFPEKKLAPVTSVGAVALARRQQLPLLTELGFTDRESLVSISMRCQCHINDLVRIGLSLGSLAGHATPAVLRIPVSAEVARRCAGNVVCRLEHVDVSAISSDAAPEALVAPSTVEVSSADNVSRIAERLRLQLQKRTKFLQRVDHFEEHLAEVGVRIASVQRDLEVVDGALVKQKPAGGGRSAADAEPIRMNCDSIAVQTDTVEELVSLAAQEAAVRVPMHVRQTQTDLTGEAVEMSLHQVSDAMGKEILLEAELLESRNRCAELETQKASVERELTAARELLQRKESTILSYQRQAEELEQRLTRAKSDVRIERVVKSSIEGEEDQVISFADAATNTMKVVLKDRYAQVEDDRGSSFLLPKNSTASSVAASRSNTSSTTSSPLGRKQPSATTASLAATATPLTSGGDVSVPPPPTTVSVGLQFSGPPRTSHRTQTVAVNVTEISEDEAPLALADAMLDVQTSMEFAALNRTVHYPPESSLRNNDVAPQDPLQPLCIAFTDIQSSTTLWSRYPDAMADAVELHHTTIRSLLLQYRGYEVKTIGDSFMCAFADVNEAVNFALDLQTEFMAKKWPEEINRCYHELVDDEPKDDGGRADSTASSSTTLSSCWNGLRVRVGMNWGHCQIRLDSVTHGYDYYGTLVNTAARVEGIGNGGQVLVTDAVLSQIGKDSPTLQSVLVTDLGAQNLRGLDHPVPIYQLCPVELGERVFPALRIEKANELSDEAMAASLQPLSEAMGRAQRAEAAALAASRLAINSVEVARLEREKSAADLLQLQAELRQQRELSMKLAASAPKPKSFVSVGTSPLGPPSTIDNIVGGRRRSSSAWSNDSSAYATPACGALDPGSGASSPVLIGWKALQRQSRRLQRQLGTIRALAQQRIDDMAGFVREALQLLIQLIQQSHDASIVEHVSAMARRLSSHIQQTIVQHQVERETSGTVAPTVSGGGNINTGTRRATSSQQSAISDADEARQFVADEITRHVTQVIRQEQELARESSTAARGAPREQAHEQQQQEAQPRVGSVRPMLVTSSSSSLAPVSGIESRPPALANAGAPAPPSTLLPAVRPAASAVSVAPMRTSVVSRVLGGGGAVNSAGTVPLPFDAASMGPQDSHSTEVVKTAEGAPGSSGSETVAPLRDHGDTGTSAHADADGGGDEHLAPQRSPVCVETRLTATAQRLEASRTGHADALLKRGHAEPSVAFSPPVVLLAGTQHAGVTVQPAAQAELERVKLKVERDVFAALRPWLDSAAPAIGNYKGQHVQQAVSALRSIRSGAPLQGPQEAAVRLYREQQSAVRREKRRLLMRRVGTNFRTRRLMERLVGLGVATDELQSLWRRWTDNVGVRQQSLRQQERINMDHLLAAILHTPSVPAASTSSGNNEYVPFVHIARYASNPTVVGSMHQSTRSHLNAPVAPIRPPRTPKDDSRSVPSSSHFRLARFDA